MRQLSLAIVVASLTSPAFAVEDHATVAGFFNWIPSDATLSSYPLVGSYRDHYVHEIRFDKGSDGKFTVGLLMPEDLSGGENVVVSLKEKSHDETTGEWTFGDAVKGYLYCNVGETWEDGGCDVQLKPLPLNSATLGAYTRNKYRGTDRAEAMGQVAERIAPEPIGSIGFTALDQVLDGGLQGTGRWDTQYQTPAGGWVTARMTIDFSRGVYDPGGQVVGRISGLIYDEATAEGGWNFGDAYGWVRFTFDGDTFTGVWGDYDSEEPRGLWRGTRVD